MRTILLLTAGLLVAACSDPVRVDRPTPPFQIVIDSVAYSAVVTQDRESTRAVLRLENLTDRARTVLLLGGNCRIRLRAFSNPSRRGELLWESHPAGVPCQLPGLHLELAPRGTAVTGHAFPGAPLRGSLHFTVTFSSGEDARELSAERIVAVG